jgi:mono/diheme cytochrome c family protein
MDKRFFFVLIPWVILGCAPGTGEGLDANSQPLTSNSAALAELKPELNAIQYNIFTPYCSGCHSGAGAPLGLKLDTVDNSYNLLVNRASSQQNTLQLVSPNDPDNSYLIHKVEGLAATGLRMPLGMSSLPADSLDALRQWISNGAEEADDTIQITSQSFDATLDAIQANVFDVSCVSCHTGANAERGLRLDSVENSFGDLVNQDSDEVVSLKLVAPLDPDNSYLIQKLEGTAYLGSSMPLAAARMPQNEINIIRQWITDGASRLLPTLSSIQTSVFDVSCTSCHAGATPSAGLSLEAGSSYSQLIGRTSSLNSGLQLVTENDSQNSYLIQILEGAALKLDGSAALRMPLTGGSLSEDTVDVIRSWIDSGALDN